SCDVAGRTDRAGRYALHLDGVPAGWFHNWADGLDLEKWSYKNGRQLSAEELEEHRRAIAEKQKEQAAERERAAQEAKDQARKDWNGAEPLSDHPYLTKKGVAAHGLKLEGDKILVPLRDIDGELWSVQRIFADGTKLFPEAGRTKSLFHQIGSDPAID